jgi:hypothetical protein
MLPSILGLLRRPESSGLLAMTLDVSWFS